MKTFSKLIITFSVAGFFSLPGYSQNIMQNAYPTHVPEVPGNVLQSGIPNERTSNLPARENIERQISHRHQLERQKEIPANTLRTKIRRAPSNSNQ